MSSAQVTATGGARAAETQLRAPPAHEFGGGSGGGGGGSGSNGQQRERSREEIELAESLLDHRQGPREAGSGRQQQQQQQQHYASSQPESQQPQSQPQSQSHQDSQQQPQYASSFYSPHDEVRRAAAQPVEPVRQQQHQQHQPPHQQQAQQQQQQQSQQLQQHHHHQTHHPQFQNAEPPHPASHSATYPLHPRPLPHQTTPQAANPQAGNPNPASNPGSANGQYCSNCGTTKTPLWRRSQLGQTICNACGLYEKARNTSRPPNLKRPPSYAPAYPAAAAAEDGSSVAAGSVLVSAESQPCQGTCPGDGKCNGTGGHAACDGCPAFNNRVSKTALLALHHSQRLTPAEGVTADQANPEAPRAPTANSIVVACQNCHTTTTPLWRRDMDGHTICNACGLYHKLHGQHRPVEMKKSFIKRRKRVAPAVGGQGFALQPPSQVSTSPASNSPESTPAYPSTPRTQYQGAPDQHWSQRSHARNPVDAQPNIDPHLDRSHYPPPVDFTQYHPRPPPESAAPVSAYPPINPLPPAPSPKRRRSLEQPGPSPQVSANLEVPSADDRRAAQANAAHSKPSNDAQSAAAGGSKEDDSEARQHKRLKRQELKDKMRRMQLEIEAMGGSDSE